LISRPVAAMARSLGMLPAKMIVNSEPIARNTPPTIIITLSFPWTPKISRRARSPGVRGAVGTARKDRFTDSGTPIIFIVDPGRAARPEAAPAPSAHPHRG
jgi:hypothetical protein